MHQHDWKLKTTTIVVVGSIVGLAAAGLLYRRRKISTPAAGDVHRAVAPRISRSELGRPDLESFSHYVARQLGFSDESECPQLCKLAIDYLRKPNGCEEKIYEFFANDENADSLFVMLVEELERCILTYFAFHWSETSLMISQVLNEGSKTKTKFRDLVLAATRKQRFEKVTRDLKFTRLLSTLVEEMKTIWSGSYRGELEFTDVMVPVAHDDRSPVLLLMGGGMGAGKSTVLKDILKEAFWSGAAESAVVVEADAFKETDVVYRALNSIGRHNDLLQTAELVHQPSKEAAWSVLVTALNEGRDVILDGTLSRAPFVEQTIAMVRNVHRRRYSMGPGDKVAEDGTVTKNYWEQVCEEEEEEDEEENGIGGYIRKAYRIELVGVVCDAHLAVVRGIRRAIMVGRAVRVKSQLESHKRFTSAFNHYCKLVDNARLYSTNAMGGPPKLIGWKDGTNKLLVDSDEIGVLKTIATLNSEAESVYELYADSDTIFRPGSIWNDIVLTSRRKTHQQALRASIQSIEQAAN